MPSRTSPCASSARRGRPSARESDGEDVADFVEELLDGIYGPGLEALLNLDDEAVDALNDNKKVFDAFDNVSNSENRRQARGQIFPFHS